MTTTIRETSSISDGELVGLSVRGDRRAYEALVERHKGIICAVTYAACGDVHMSEDLAQETFFQGWKHLGELREPGKLRGWLAGIARNVAGMARRKRVPVVMEGSAMEGMAKEGGESPAERAMSAEEARLLWAGLERLPEMYREPMVLYYRENESVGAVAAGLELSEAAVKQRLARGRAMLAERMEKWMGEGLWTSAPTKAFTAAVVTGLAGVTVSAKAATVGGAGAAMAKGSGGAKGVAMAGGILGGAFLGPMIALVGGIVPNYLAYRSNMARSLSEEERKEVKRWFMGMTVVVMTFVVFMVAWVMEGKGLERRFGVAAVMGTGYMVSVAYAVGMIVFSSRSRKRIKKIRGRYFEEHPEELEKVEERGRYLGEHPEELAKIIERPYRSGWGWLGDNRLVRWVLPRGHRVTRVATFRQAPAALFEAITRPEEWRKGFTRLADVGGRRRWLKMPEGVSVTGGMMMVFEEVENDSPRVFGWRIVNRNLPFAGSWKWEIEAAEGGCECRITEEGETASLIVRFMGRFVFGFGRTVEWYLRGLGERFGEKVRIGKGK